MSESGGRQGNGDAASTAKQAKVVPITGRAPVERMATSPEVRQRMIAEAAYFKWLSRGFIHGEHLADWLDAEAEIDSRLP